MVPRSIPSVKVGENSLGNKESLGIERDVVSCLYEIVMVSLFISKPCLKGLEMLPGSSRDPGRREKLGWLSPKRGYETTIQLVPERD